jgi:hypothetical protein
VRTRDGVGPGCGGLHAGVHVVAATHPTAAQRCEDPPVHACVS